MLLLFILMHAKQVDGVAAIKLAICAQKEATGPSDEEPLFYKKTTAEEKEIERQRKFREKQRSGGGPPQFYSHTGFVPCDAREARRFVLKKL